MSKGQRILEIALVFAAFFLPGFLAQGSARPTADADLTALMLQTILSGIPQLLLMIYLVSVQPDWSPERWGIAALRGRDAARIVVLAAACMALALLFAGLLRILPETWAPFLFRGYRWALARPSQIPLAILFGLTAGYREEFFFRAYLLERLGGARLPSAAAIALSTALFAAGHLYEGILGVAISASLGVLFALVYVRQRNLHVVAIGHGLYNILALALGLLGPLQRGPGPA